VAFCRYALRCRLPANPCRGRVAAAGADR
jgi:hypothetical protein